MAAKGTVGGGSTVIGRIEAMARERLVVLVRPQADAGVAAQVPDLIREVEALCAGGDAGARRCLHAGLWLLADDLDKAHGICQQIETEYGSAWHAHLHRREGDFSNSKYWWRKTEGVKWEGMDRRVAEALADGPAEARGCVRGGRYDPAVFVDLVEEHAGSGGQWEGALVALQRAEWLSLFEECLAAAGAKTQD